MPVIPLPHPPLPDEGPASLAEPKKPEPRKAPTASAHVSLACGHQQELKDWNYYLIPNTGDELPCWHDECKGALREVTQIAML